MTGPRTTGVWISANSATVLRWSPELTVRHRIDSTSAVGAIEVERCRSPVHRTVRVTGRNSDPSAFDSLCGADRRAPERPALEVPSKRAVRHLRGRFHRRQMKRA
jgi:hypothetical protein